MDFNNQHYIDTHKKFTENGWISSQNHCQVTFKQPGNYYEEFSIKMENNKTIVSVTILHSKLQYSTTVFGIDEACEFLQTHLEYNTQNKVLT